MLAGKLEIEMHRSLARLSKDMTDAKKEVSRAVREIEESMIELKAALINIDRLSVVMHKPIPA